MSHPLIDQYEQGSEKLALAVRGLKADDLAQQPTPDAAPKVGSWSIGQIVIHLADADLVIAERIKRVIAEDNPPLAAFDETAWARRLFYAVQSVQDALSLLEINRRQVTRILRQLPQETFARFGTHSSAGKVTLDDLVRGAVDHLNHHLSFIHAKRAWMGKELW